MKLSGETVALQTNFGVNPGIGGGGGYGGNINNMMGSLIPPNLPSSIFSTSNLSLGLPKLGEEQRYSVNVINNSNVSAPATTTSSNALLQSPSLAQTMMENQAKLMMKESLSLEETESKSSSENMEAGSGGEDQQELVEENMAERPAKKRYHRHTLHQIAEMERVFKECPHPDEKQRQELSRELKLSARQIKFWFQNKRTQMKAQHERQDNNSLRSENERLKAENFALRDAVRHVSCPSCGGPASLAEMSMEEQQLRIENVRLREEIERITAMAAKYIGRHVPTPGNGMNSSGTAPPSSSTTIAAAATTASHQPSMNDDADEQLLVSPSHTNTSSIINNNINNNVNNNINNNNNAANSSSPSVAEIASRPFGLTDAEKPLVVDLAVTAMDELLHVSSASCSDQSQLWLLDPSTGDEYINHDAYVQLFPHGIGSTPPALRPESSRHTGLVIMNAISLVETLMDMNRLVEMFPSIISRAHCVEVLSAGIGGTYDGAIQLMYAEFQLPSPLVPTRENYFLRYSKRVDSRWAVVDVSIDSVRGNPPPSLLRCRRRPSGCVIEELQSGYSKVTWVEHVEADCRGVHNLYKAFVGCGMGFGAKRWLCTLQRQCERIASVLASNIPSAGGDMAAVVPSGEGRRSMLKLAERMTNNFCGGVSASTAHTWVTLAGSGGADDVRVVIRKSVDDPGRPPGIVLSAATSLWLPVAPSKVFHFLRDERFRTEWDILSNTGVVEEMFHVAKGQDPGNCVSLLRVNPIDTNQSNMLILQECCTDESCSLVVYAPVDIAAMSAVLNGGDPECVALLPSGFAILPAGPMPASPPPPPVEYSAGMGGPLEYSAGAGSSAPLEYSAGLIGGGPLEYPSAAGGSLLTVAFQILVDHVPTARLSLGSVATVNKLISNTVVRIKSALALKHHEMLGMPSS